MKKLFLTLSLTLLAPLFILSSCGGSGSSGEKTQNSSNKSELDEDDFDALPEGKIDIVIPNCEHGLRDDYLPFIKSDIITLILDSDYSGNKPTDEVYYYIGPDSTGYGENSLKKIKLDNSENGMGGLLRSFDSKSVALLVKVGPNASYGTIRKMVGLIGDNNLSRRYLILPPDHMDTLMLSNYGNRYRSNEDFKSEPYMGVRRKPIKNSISMVLLPSGLFLSIEGSKEKPSQLLRKEVIMEALNIYNRYTGNSVWLTPDEIEELSRMKLFGFPIDRVHEILRGSDEQRLEKMIEMHGVPYNKTNPYNNEVNIWLDAFDKVLNNDSNNTSVEDRLFFIADESVPYWQVEPLFTIVMVMKFGTLPLIKSNNDFTGKDLFEEIKEIDYDNVTEIDIYGDEFEEEIMEIYDIPELKAPEPEEVFYELKYLDEDIFELYFNIVRINFAKRIVGDETFNEIVNDEPMSMAMVEQKPQFPGGDSAMYKWLSDHITYPTQAAEEGVEGRVVVQFVIGKDGSIQKVVVVRGRHPALDKEAVRLVNSMPNWEPGRNSGQPVKVTYVLPVTFKLPQ